MLGHIRHACSRRPAGTKRPSGVGGLVAVCLALASAAATAAGAAEVTGPDRDRPLRAELQAILDDHLRARRGPEGITAISAFVSRSDGDPGIAAVAGTTSRSGGRPLTPRTLFQIGSNTKAFTGAAVLRLEAAGRLDIDQTVGDWLPQYPAWGRVSIRRLLNMTSGIPTYSEAPRFMRHQAADRFRHYTPEQLVAYAYPSPGNRLPPSSGYFYSNTNYALAGMIAAKAGGSGYDEQLRRGIFRPLQLRDTFYASWAVPPWVIGRMPSGYFENPSCSLYRPGCRAGPLAPLDGLDMRDADLSWTGAAGGIISTPHDLARWVRGLFGGRVLPPRQLAEMQQLVSTRTGRPLARTTAADPSGFGLGISQIYDAGLGRVWFFEGVTLGYRSAFMYFPRRDLVVAATVNSQPREGEDRIAPLLLAIQRAVARRP